MDINNAAPGTLAIPSDMARKRLRSALSGDNLCSQPDLVERIMRRMALFAREEKERYNFEGVEPLVWRATLVAGAGNTIPKERPEDRRRENKCRRLSL